MLEAKNESRRADLNDIVWFEEAARDRLPIDECSHRRLVIFKFVAAIRQLAYSRVQAADGQIFEENRAVAAAPNGNERLNFDVAANAAQVRKVEPGNGAGICITLLTNMHLASPGRRLLERSGGIMREKHHLRIAETQNIAIDEQVFRDGLVIDDAVAAAVIVPQDIAVIRIDDAGLLAMHGEILKKNITFAAAPNGSIVFTNFQAFANLNPLLDH